MWSLRVSDLFQFEAHIINDFSLYQYLDIGKRCQQIDACGFLNP